MAALRFDEYVEAALYGPSGFYTTHGIAGRDDADFITSVETSAWFGRLLARFVDAEWAAQGRPDPFLVVEVGSGRGTLCRDVFSGLGEGRDAVRYLMVERSAALRSQAMALVATEIFPDDEVVPVASLERLPSRVANGVVLANELLDNLPFRVVERSRGAWFEVHIDQGEEVLLECDAAASAMATALCPDAADGVRIPLQVKQAAWVTQALRTLERGPVLCFDYARTTREMSAAGQDQWLRTYRRHGRGGEAAANPGEQDITVDVAVDQLPGLPQLQSQRDFLIDLGALVERRAAHDRWTAHAAEGGLEAMWSRTTMTQLDALLDPDGLGGFTVMRWR